MIKAYMVWFRKPGASGIKTILVEVLEDTYIKSAIQEKIGNDVTVSSFKEQSLSEVMVNNLSVEDFILLMKNI